MASSSPASVTSPQESGPTNIVKMFTTYTNILTEASMREYRGGVKLAPIKPSHQFLRGGWVNLYFLHWILFWIFSVGYKMIIANLALCTSLAIYMYHLISSAQWWNNNCFIKNTHKMLRIFPDFICKNNRHGACIMAHIAWWLESMMARALELYYPMIQFLTMTVIVFNLHTSFLVLEI